MDAVILGSVTGNRSPKRNPRGHPALTKTDKRPLAPVYMPGIQILPAGISSVPAGMGSGSSDLQ